MDHIMMKTVRKSIQELQNLLIYILKLDKGMLVNILQVLQAKLILPTCPKCFLQTFIIVLSYDAVTGLFATL